MNKNSSDLFRYCTSVGIYQGYDKKEKSHLIAVRMPDVLVKEGGRIKYFQLDEYQFMLWYVCHGEIITEDDMYERVSELWQSCDIYPKKPILKSYHELQDMGLLYTEASQSNEIVLYELSTMIQPYVISLFDYSHLQKRVTVFLEVLSKTILSFFLPKDEKKIIKYFRNNTGTTFYDYIEDEKVVQSGEYLTIGRSINNLLKKGYVFPVGWAHSVHT